MSTLKMTERARDALESAMRLAQSNLNTTVEPEHLLKAILETNSILNTLILKQDLDNLSNIVSVRLSQLPRTQASVQPQVSYALSSLLSDASKLDKTHEYISLHHLLLVLLGIQSIIKLVEQAFTKPTPSDIKKAIQEHLNTTKMNSAQADDPENKMSKFAVEMVEQARKNKYDPVIGRDNEIRQVIEILAKRGKSNAILVGKPGVGKTAIVTGIAQLIARGEAPAIADCKIYNVDLGAMVAGTAHRGDFEERLKGLVAEATADPKVVLFIDEIHIVLGAGSVSGSLDAANILKPGLADGSLKVIGATTYDEYRKYVTKDPAFERRFARVNVKEQSIEDTITVMRGLKERLEMHHGLKISDRALVFASVMGKRYIPSRRLPDLAIDLVDTACASAIISMNSEPPEMASIRSKIWSLELEKTSIEMDRGVSDNQQLITALNSVDEKIAALRNELSEMEEEYNKEKGHLIQARTLKQKLEEAKNRVEQARRDNNRYLVWDLQTNIIPVYEKQLKECSNKVEVIGPENIATIISRWSGVPVQRLTMKESDRLLSMNDRIKERIYGQNEAVETVCESILANRAGLGRENRPIGSFLFVGPTGVGKTELAKALCTELNGTTENMVVLDMSDYANEISLTKLIGAPAGYVGCEEGGALTEPIKEMPYNVVLLDEVDLAHPSVVNVLYQLLDEGRVTDGRGVKVSFRDCVVVMTTNLGQEYIGIGAVDRAGVMRRITERFGSPLVNRVDNIVIFNHLNGDALERIILYEIGELNRKLEAKEARFVPSEAVVRDAVEQAVGSPYGARVLKRFVRDNFVGTITRVLLGRTEEGFLEIGCFLNEEGREGIVCGRYTYSLATAETPS